MKARWQKGFTLIELVIVVAIVALLAALALYNYSKYGYRSRRSDGKEALMQASAAMERYYTATNRYPTSLVSVGFATNPWVTKPGYYSVSTANGTTGDTQSFLLTAAPVLGQPQQPTAATIDACKSLTLASDGTQSQTGTNSNGNCW